MIEDPSLSPDCLDCPVCGAGCPEANHALSPRTKEVMGETLCALLEGAAMVPPHQCWHCSQAACLEACPSGAMRRDEATGLTYVDVERCVGCWMCVLACPNGAVVPSADGRHAVKCDGCRGRDVPACAGVCQPRDSLFRQTVQTDSIKERRARYAAAGWGWPGTVSHPPFQADPKLPQPVSRQDSSLRHVIVGSGIAAVRAVEAIRRFDAECSITLVSDETVPPYSRVLLSHLVAGIRDEAALALRTAEWPARMKVDLIAGDTAKGLDTDRRVVTLESGHEVPYDRLLVATGASSVRLRIPGADLPEVIGLRNLPDAAAILADPPANAVVIGGGFIGLKAGEALHARGTRVTIVEKLPHLLPQMLDPTAAEMVASRLEAHGIRVMAGVGVQEIVGNGHAEGVLLETGERLDGRLIVVGVGVVPNIAWLRNSPVRLGRGIITDGQMRTSVPDVWAAGDVVESADLVSGAKMVNAIWPVAALQGRIAGANMVGEIENYPGSLPMNTLDIFGMAVASFGQVKGDDETVLVHEGDQYRKRVCRDGALVGAILVGDIREAGRMLAESYRG